MRGRALAHPMSARVDQRSCAWYLNLLQCLDTILCLPTRSLQCRSLSGWACFSSSESSYLPQTDLASPLATNAESLPTHHLVQCPGSPTPTSTVGHLCLPWWMPWQTPCLSAQCLHHIVTKGSLRRRAHRATQGHPVPQVDLSVAVHQADLWQTLLSVWPSSCLTPLCLTSPGLESTVRRHRSRCFLFLLLSAFFRQNTHPACASESTYSGLFLLLPLHTHFLRVPLSPALLYAVEKFLRWDVQVQLLKC